MTEDLSELHDELRSVARSLLAPTAAATDTEGSPAPVDWDLLARSGWLGLEVPDALEGAGATFAETAVVLEELGRAASATSYLGGVVLAVGALGLVEPSPIRDDLLGRIAVGEARVAVAVVDGAVDEVAPPAPFRLERAAAGAVVDGRAEFVPDAPGAAELLVVADTTDGPALVHVAADAAGITVEDQPVLDAGRRLARVTARHVDVGRGAVMAPAAGTGALVERLVDRAALAVACDALGVARAMLDATVGYVAVREQFGRAVGSFQAVKHACADMLVDIVVAEELVRAAVAALVAGDPGAGVAVSMAKARTSEVAVRVVGKALQLHGGIGYTWESGIHRYLKRAALDRSLFGSPAAHRRRLAARYAERG